MQDGATGFVLEGAERRMEEGRGRDGSRNEEDREETLTSGTGEYPVSDLVVIEFPSEAKAEEVRQKLLDMQKDYLIELSDAVIAFKQPNGRIKLNQLYHPAATDAADGAP